MLQDARSKRKCAFLIWYEKVNLIIQRQTIVIF